MEIKPFNRMIVVRNSGQQSFFSQYSWFQRLDDRLFGYFLVDKNTYCRRERLNFANILNYLLFSEIQGPNPGTFLWFIGLHVPVVDQL